MTQIGLTFLAVSVPFFISSPLWGKICDEYFNPNMVQPIGHIFIAVGFIFLGPVGYIPKEVGSLFLSKLNWIPILLLHSGPENLKKV